jgi:hypothetical protein
MIDPWKGYYDSSAQLNETLQRQPANQLARMQLAKGQQEMDDDAAVRNAMQQSGGDLSRAIPAVAQTGNVKAAMGLQKMQDEQQKSKIDTELNRYKIAAASAERIANAPRELAAQIAEEEIIKNSQMFGQDPTAHLQYLYQTHAKGGPDAIIMDARKASMSIKEQMDLQNKQQTLNRQDDHFNWQKRHGSDTLAQQANIALLNDARARDIAKNKDVASKEQGKVPSGFRVTADGNLEAIPGGPADAKKQAQDQLKIAGVTDVDLAIGTLRDAYDRLEKGGGITSTQKGGLSNIGAASSSSSVGQAVGKALGTQNQSARNDIAMTRPALLAALMKATGMSAKQMDSNAELKLWLATATDPTLDVESNRRALDNIEKKYMPKDGPQKPPSTPKGAAFGGVNPETGQMEYFDAAGKKL